MLNMIFFFLSLEFEVKCDLVMLLTGLVRFTHLGSLWSLEE